MFGIIIEERKRGEQRLHTLKQLPPPMLRWECTRTSAQLGAVVVFDGAINRKTLVQKSFRAVLFAGEIR